MESFLEVYWTDKEFSYYHKKLKKMIKTRNKIPFIVDWDGFLLNDINEYLLFKTENQWDAGSKTPKNNSQQILMFLDHCYQNNINYKKVSGGEIKAYVAFLTKNGNKSTSIKQKLSVLENLYVWLESNGLISFNPFEEFGKVEVKHIIKSFSKKNQNTKTYTNINRFLKTNNEIEDIPTIEDLKEVYNSLNNNDKLMMQILLETGMRKEEILQLTLGMVKSMEISKSGKSYSLKLDSNIMQIKYNKSRNVIINTRLREKILKHTISDDYKKYKIKYRKNNTPKNENEIPLFISNRGHKFSTDKLNKTFHKKSILLNIKPFSPHQLRHFYASSFIYDQEKKGNNMEQAYIYLSERLGHSSPETTKSFYVKLLNRKEMIESAEESLEDFAVKFLN